MRSVVIIGGGFSGLVAAYTLEQYNIPYTLIEVKPRLGGSIHTERRDDGFIVDHGQMFTLATDEVTFLYKLGLRDSVYVAREDEDGQWWAFKNGMGELIETLSHSLRASKITRMAVSTLGVMDTPKGKRFSICMENGILFDAQSLIVAAPARHAERLFYAFKPDISLRLLDYRYDAIARVSLGYRCEDVGTIPHEPPPDYPVTYIHSTDAPERVPDGHVLIQMGVRYEPDKGLSSDIVGEVTALMKLPQNPVFETVSVWTESDPINWLQDQHAAAMTDIQHLLPQGVALIGNDYLPDRPTLQARYDMAVQGVERVVNWLQGQ